MVVLSDDEAITLAALSGCEFFVLGDDWWYAGTKCDEARAFTLMRKHDRSAPHACLQQQRRACPQVL